MKPILLVLAAGMGSRYGGVKQIDSIGNNNECLLDFATYDAKKAGFGKVVYIIRKDIEKDFRERLFDRVARNFDAEYVFQSMPENRKKPWGTLHAVLCAEEKLKAPFAVINADDYYGAQAFKILAEHLSALDADSTEHAMVSYILGKTMSRSGSVSRGVCEIQDGYLKSIKENKKIFYESPDSQKIISQIEFEDGSSKEIEMTGKEAVSMNFFGFSQKALEHFHIYWDDFIEKNALSEKAEALLPEAASQIVNLGKGKIKVYSSSEAWFGMTYPQDRDIVKAEIAKKISESYYPKILWQN